WVGFPCQQRDFEILRVVITGADDSARPGYPGSAELGGGGDLDNARAGVAQLLDDRRRQRVVAADDDVAAHAHARFASSGINPTSGGVGVRSLLMTIGHRPELCHRNPLTPTIWPPRFDGGDQHRCAASAMASARLVDRDEILGPCPRRGAAAA